MSQKLDTLLMSLGFDPASTAAITKLVNDTAAVDKNLGQMVDKAGKFAEAVKKLKLAEDKLATAMVHNLDVSGAQRQVRAQKGAVTRARNDLGIDPQDLRAELASRVKQAERLKKDTIKGLEAFFNQLRAGMTDPAQITKLNAAMKGIIDSVINNLKASATALTKYSKEKDRELQQALREAGSNSKERRRAVSQQAANAAKQDGARGAEQRKQRQMDSDFAKREREERRQREVTTKAAEAQLKEQRNKERKEQEAKAKAEMAQYGTEQSRLAAARRKVRDDQANLLAGYGQGNTQAKALINYQAANNPAYIRHLTTVAGKMSRSSAELGYSKDAQAWAQVQKDLKQLIKSLEPRAKTDPLSNKGVAQAKESTLRDLASRRFAGGGGLDATQLRMAVDAQMRRVLAIGERAQRYPNSPSGRRLMEQETSALKAAQEALKAAKAPVRPVAERFDSAARNTRREQLLQAQASQRFNPATAASRYDFDRGLKGQLARTEYANDLASRFPNSARAQRFFAEEKAALEAGRLALKEFNASLQAPKPRNAASERSYYQQQQMEVLARRRYAGLPATASLEDASVAIKAQEARVGRAFRLASESPGRASTQAILANEQQALAAAKARRVELQAQLQLEQRIGREQNTEANRRLNAARLASQGSPEAIRNRTIIQARQSDDRMAYDGGASLFRTQLGLLQNYALMGAGVGGIAATGQFMAELDKEMHQLQAIVGLTNTEMAGLEERLIAVSEKTKFTAVEVTQAAVILGQAGLGKDAIAESIEGITLFAAAVGSDLTQAVDIATSALGVYNIEAERMPDVVDKLTTAVNKSKLNIDKLTLGIQYAGNIAYQSNVTFEDTVAALGAMANSGVKSGSTLGTGLRQILITLQKPSQEFLTITQGLGLSLYDLDLKSHGLVGVMSNLANAGFTVRDAMRSMEVRAASAYGAFANNIGVAEDLVEAMSVGGSATKANEVQMQSFSNTLAQTTSIFKTFMAEGLDPLLVGLTEVIRAGGSFLSWLRELKAAGPIFSGLMSAAGLALVMATVRRLTLLLKNLPRATLWAANLGQAAAPAAATAAGGGLGAAARGARVAGRAALGAAAGPWGLGAAFVGAAAYEVYDAYADKGDALDKATAALNENQSQMEKNEFWATKLAKSMDDLYAKQYQLTEANGAEGNLRRYIEQLNNEFKDLGLYLDSSTNSFDDVTRKLREFRLEVARLGQAGLDEQGGLLATTLAEQKNSFTKDKPFFLGRSEAEKPETLLNSENPRQVLSLRGASAYTNDSILRAVTGVPVTTQIADLVERRQALRPGEESPEVASKLVSEFKTLNAALIKAGALPDKDILALLEARGLTTRKELNGDGQLVDVPTGITPAAVRELIQSYITPLDKTTQSLTEYTKTAADLEDFRKGVPQEAAKQQAQLTQQFQETIFKQLAEQSRERSEMQESAGSDTVGLYNEAQEKFASYTTMADELEASMRQYIADTFKVTDKADQNQLLEKAGLMAGLNQLTSEAMAFRDQAKGMARPQFMLQNQAESTRVSEEIRALESEMGDSLTSAEMGRIQGELAQLRARLSALDKQKKLFDTPDDPDNPTRQGIVLEGDFALQAQLRKDAEKVNQLSAYEKAYAGFERGEFPIAGDSKAMNKEVQRAMKDWWASRQSQLDEQLTTELERVNATKAQLPMLERQVQAYQDRFNDASLPEEERLGVADEIVVGLKQVGELNSSVLRQQIAAYKAQTAELQKTLDSAKERLKDPTLLGGAKAQTERLAADAGKAIAENNKKVSDLTLQLAETKLATLDQIDAQKQNTKALERSRYRYKSDDYERQRVDLYGGKMETEGGEVYERPAAEGMGEVAVNAGESIKKNFIEAYEGGDALVGIVAGLNDQMANLDVTVGSAFASWVTGAQSAEDAVRSMAAGMAQALAELAAQQAMMGILSTIASAWAGGGGAGGGNSGYNAAGGTGSYGGGFATGGLVTTGVRSRDSTFIKARKGEFVLRPEAVDAIGLDTVTAMNNLDASRRVSMSGVSGGAGQGETGDEKTSVTNIWVVLPEEKPQSMGANDVLVTVQDDIRRGGVTRRLIKQVVEKR